MRNEASSRGPVRRRSTQWRTRWHPWSAPAASIRSGRRARRRSAEAGLGTTADRARVRRERPSARACRERGELVRGDQLAFEPRLVGAQSGGRPEDAPGLADRGGPQGQATRLVRSRARHDGGHEVVHRRRGQGAAGEPDPQRDVLLLTVVAAHRGRDAGARPFVHRPSLGAPPSAPGTRTFALGAMSAMVVCTTASSPSAGRTCAM